MTDRDQERGQASVELALVLPLIALLALAILQTALVGRDAVLLSHAAREAARAAAIEPGSGGAAARRASGLDEGRLKVTEHRRGDRLVRVEVRYRSVTDLPVIGALVPDVRLSTTIVIRSEAPVSL